MSTQIIITDETALEIKAAIQCKLDEIGEGIGINIGTMGITYNSDSFMISVIGQVGKKKFDAKPEEKRKYLS